MNIDEIDIYDYFLKGFENDLKRVEEAEPYHTTIPYILLDFLERRGALNFAYNSGILEPEGLLILSDMSKEILKKLNEKLNDRLKWHGDRLDEHLGNVTANLVMVNCCNDLLKPLGMDFTDEKKITDN
jgi:hypothetical protein